MVGGRWSLVGGCLPLVVGNGYAGRRSQSTQWRTIIVPPPRVITEIYVHANC